MNFCTINIFRAPEMTKKSVLGFLHSSEWISCKILSDNFLIFSVTLINSYFLEYGAALSFGGTFGLLTAYMGIHWHK